MSLMVMSSVCFCTARPLCDVVHVFTWHFLRQLIKYRYSSDNVFHVQLQSVLYVGVRRIT